MPPRIFPAPPGTFASHAKHLQKRRVVPQCLRLASSDAATLWRGQDPITRLGQSITGEMEWRTSSYSYNKQTIKTHPVASMNVEKLIQYFVTIQPGDTRGMDARTIRTAVNARRKSANRVYVSSPRIKDYGDRITMTAFIYHHHVRPRGSQHTDTGVERKPPLPPLLRKTEGLESLLSRIYGKPVHLTLTQLAAAHLDADILARLVAQRLRDRILGAARAIRDATWKTPLPDAQEIVAIQQKKQLPTRSSMTWRDLTLRTAARTTASSIVRGLALSQVSSVQVEANGRLTKRITADRSGHKVARKGATSKGPSKIVRGLRKAHMQYAAATGKRRVGQYGVKVYLAHS